MTFSLRFESKSGIANAAGLPDDDWNPFALARDVALALLPVFAGLGPGPPRLRDST